MTGLPRRSSSSIGHAMVHRVSLFTLALAVAAGAHAAEPTIHVAEPWARLVPPGAKVSASFLTVENRGGEPDALLGASCACAEVVELHVMAEEGGAMRMRQVERFTLPAGGKLELRPGGPHLMLIGLTGDLAADEKLPLVLRFERAGEVTVEVVVRDPRPAAGH